MLFAVAYNLSQVSTNLCRHKCVLLFTIFNIIFTIQCFTCPKIIKLFFKILNLKNIVALKTYFSLFQYTLAATDANVESIMIIFCTKPAVSVEGIIMNCLQVL